MSANPPTENSITGSVSERGKVTTAHGAVSRDEYVNVCWERFDSAKADTVTESTGVSAGGGEAGSTGIARRRSEIEYAPGASVTSGPDQSGPTPGEPLSRTGE